MAIDKIMSKKVFLQDDDKVQGAYVNTARRFPPSFSHKSDTFNLTKYIKDIVATVLTGSSTVFVSITALSANIGKNLFGFGTATAPSITFNTDDNTGIYHPATDTIGFTTGGTPRATVSSTGLAVNNITEYTAASGVTIDGVLLKDSGLVLSGFVTQATTMEGALAVTAGAITAATSLTLTSMFTRLSSGNLNTGVNLSGFTGVGSRVYVANNSGSDKFVYANTAGTTSLASATWGSYTDYVTIANGTVYVFEKITTTNWICYKLAV